MLKCSLEPKDQSICFALTQQVKLEDSVNLYDFVIGGSLKIEGKKLCNFADN